MNPTPTRDEPVSSYFRHRALVVDDHPFMRAIVRNVLRDIGFGDVRSAADGAEALDMLARSDFRFDIVVCDIDMEPMNGLEFLSHLRSHMIEALRDIPVVLLTSHAEKAKVVEARKAGTDAYLLKPVSRANLQSRVEFVLSQD